MTDQNDHENGEPEDEMREQMRKYEQVFRGKTDDVEAAGRRCGLYVRDIGLSMAPNTELDEDGDQGMAMRPVMVLNFSVGDVAWSDRIQNPAQDTTEAEFRKMAVEAEKEKFEETRAELERRLREGKDLLGGDDDESDSGTSQG